VHVRTVAAVVGTAGGLALLVSFKTPSTSGPSKASVEAAAPPATTATTGAPTTPQRGAATTPRPPGTSGAVSSAPTPSPSTTVPTGATSVKGPVVSTRYGDVQVEVDTSGGRITNVVALQLPSDRRRSAEISAYAKPILHNEAIQAQSAQIDVVSGATYTSDAYAQSLQAALDGHA
jgi:uncharacterized protein with FMN-binding domain